MPLYNVPAFPVGKFVLVDVVDYQEDGVTPDLTEPLSVSSNYPGVAQATIDPAEPRKVKITGLAAGSATITVAAPGVPSNLNLAITVTITPPPNLSKLEATGHTGPF